jgi:hypothetical protein
MGHASITMTYDLYGHLLPGSRDEVRECADATWSDSSVSARASLCELFHATSFRRLAVC